MNINDTIVADNGDKFCIRPINNLGLDYYQIILVRSGGGGNEEVIRTALDFGIAVTMVLREVRKRRLA